MFLKIWMTGICLILGSANLAFGSNAGERSPLIEVTQPRSSINISQMDYYQRFRKSTLPLHDMSKDSQEGLKAFAVSSGFFWGVLGTAFIVPVISEGVFTYLNVPFEDCEWCFSWQEKLILPSFAVVHLRQSIYQCYDNTLDFINWCRNTVRTRKHNDGCIQFPLYVRIPMKILPLVLSAAHIALYVRLFWVSESEHYDKDDLIYTIYRNSVILGAASFVPNFFHMAAQKVRNGVYYCNSFTRIGGMRYSDNKHKQVLYRTDQFIELIKSMKPIECVITFKEANDIENEIGELLNQLNNIDLPENRILEIITLFTDLCATALSLGILPTVLGGALASFIGDAPGYSIGISIGILMGFLTQDILKEGLKGGYYSLTHIFSHGVSGFFSTLGNSCISAFAGFESFTHMALFQKLYPNWSRGYIFELNTLTQAQIWAMNNTRWQNHSGRSRIPCCRSEYAKTFKRDILQRLTDFRSDVANYVYPADAIHQFSLNINDQHAFAKKIFKNLASRPGSDLVPDVGVIQTQ